MAMARHSVSRSRSPRAPMRRVQPAGAKPGLFEALSKAPRGSIGQSFASAVEGKPGPKLFKADGTPVRDPAAFVNGMMRTGGYKGGLFNDRGKEIRDPLAYVRKMAPPLEPATRPMFARSPALPTAPPTGSGQLFKADGTPVKNPAAFVAAMEKTGGYRGGLVNEKGEEIRDPIAYVARMSGGSPAPAAPLSRSKVSSSSDGVSVCLFKEDGTLVKNPAAYVAAMEASGGYRGGLFNEKNDEIVDPVGYLTSLGVKIPGVKTLGAPPMSTASPPSPKLVGSVTLFKADGTPVKNPAAYVAAMEKTGGYKGGLFDDLGAEIDDPVAYVAEMMGTTARSKPVASKTTVSGVLPSVSETGPPAASVTLFKADGTPVKNPAMYVAAMMKSGGYRGGLFNEQDEEVKDPIAYLVTRGVAVPASPAPPTRIASAPPASRIATAPPGLTNQLVAAKTGGAINSNLYKADGTLVKNPAAYVASMVKTGGYNGGLFNSRGEEIRDPVAYIAHMQSSGSLTSFAPKPPPPPDDDYPNTGLFKEDGTMIRDPAAYLAGMERSENGSKGGLVDGEGREVLDLAAFVAAMDTNLVEAIKAKKASSSSRPEVDPSKAPLFKRDGTPIRDAVAYVRGMAGKGGDYKGGLFDKNGVEIVDPQAFVEQLASEGLDDDSDEMETTAV